MKIITRLDEWRAVRAGIPAHSASIGFIPTMGALHAGHRSLIERSVRENKITVVSIFVNPTQFNDPADFQKYPNTWELDVKLAELVGVDYLLAPLFTDIYPDEYRYLVDENEFSRLLCGAHRPGHFQGVLTVVMRLFNLIDPTRSYFGEKDYQQYKLIEGMAKAFFLRTEVVGCPTVREPDGLAMSSRNIRLNQVNRERAPLFHRVLKSGATLLEMRNALEESGFKVDYLEELPGRRLGAVILDGVRLIDNVET